MQTSPTEALPVLEQLLSRPYASPGEAATLVCRALCQLLGVDVAFVTRLDGDVVEVVTVDDAHSLGLQEGTRLARQDAFCGRALDSGAPTWCSDLAGSPYADVPARTALGVSSYAMVPLHDAEGAAVGTLCLLDRAPLHREEGERRLLDILGGLLARELELERVRGGEAAARESLARRAAELEASEERYRTLVDQMRDIIVLVGPAGEIEFVNRAWTEVTGVPVEEVLGTGGFDRVHPDDRALAVEHLQALAGGSEEGAREVRFLGADGEYRWMAVKGRARRDGDGNLAGFAGMLEDVTGRRRAEEQVRAALSQAETARDEAHRALEEAQRASRAKSEFLSRMSHELRTPLNAILGFGQLLQLGELDEEEGENVEQILKAGHHLLDLINEVLDVVRVEAGKLTLSLEEVQVGDVVAESLDLVRVAASGRRINLRAPARRAGAVVVADRQRLKQVLVNLLSNAVKYNLDEGEVTVDCMAMAPGDGPTGDEGGLPDAGHGWLRISVTDTGRGIAAHQLEDVFTPFERLGAETSDIQGTGIGLSLTRTLVEAQGGRIGVTSEPGRGSTFWVDLPAAAPLDQAPPPPVERPEFDHTVLYVEDNPSNIALVRRVFARRPQVRLVVVNDGTDAVCTAERLLPDLVLLDLHLPGMHGDAVLRGLRASQSAHLREVPVVVVTADLTTGTERRMIEAGATRFMPKPIDVRHLLDVVDEHLARA